MGRLETVSTTNVAASKKMRFWNATVSAAVASAAADPLDENTFQGRLRLLDLDNIRVAEVCGGASNVRRFPAHARGGHFVLQLILFALVAASDRVGVLFALGLSLACIPFALIARRGRVRLPE